MLQILDIPLKKVDSKKSNISKSSADDISIDFELRETINP